MLKVWYVIPILLAVTIPNAFAQVETTTGENYDLIENYFTGEAVWNSHVPRILDGEWKNYVLENNSDKVIFNSNSIGSFVFDKNSCSYSIYENGFVSPETQIIPSVSAVATHNNGAWSNMNVNDSSCDVIVIENQNGIELTSTKLLESEVNELLNFNGTSINATTFIQEINLDVNKGIKETFYIYDNSNSGNELGVSQTIHTGESIVMGTEEIQISDFDGMSFDKDFIIENESEILQVAQNLNYDMDKGLDYLSSVNIIHDSNFFDNTYKVNLDYSGGNFVGYLEIDPTLTTTGSGTFDIIPLHTHDISSGTIDNVSLTTPQITNLQTDIDSFNQYHTLSGTTLIVSYTIATVPQPPTDLITTSGVPIELDFEAPIDDGDSTITQYNIFRTDNQYAKTELPNNSANSNGIDFTDNEFLIQGFETNGNLEDKSTNNISVTQTTPSTSTNGIIGNGVQSPDLSFTNTNIPDNADDFTVSSWVKLDSTPTNTEILKLNDITFNVDSTSASISGQTTGPSNGGAWGTSVSNDNVDLKADSSNWSETAIVGFTGSATVTADKIQWSSMSTSSSGNIWYGSERIISGSVWESVMTGDWNWNVKMDTGSARYHMLKTEIHFNDGKMLGTLNYATTSGGAYVRVVDQNGYTHVGGNPFYPEFSKVGNLYKVCKPSSSCKQVTTSSGIDYILIKGLKNNAYGNNKVIYTESVELSGQHTGIIDFDVITATGLTSNTVDPQMYTFTRSGNDFKIYQNAILESSATDSTSLGSNSGQDYTINLDGMIDEYFIDSTALTSTEIDTIYDNSKDLTPIATSTITEYNDNSVIAGNSYFYSASSVNNIGDSVYLTPFVSALSGVVWGIPTNLSATVSDVDATPLLINLSWDASTQGSGTGVLTGYELFANGVSIGTVGTVTSSTHQLSSPGTVDFTIKSLSTHGNSVTGNIASVTTPSTPGAPTLTLAINDPDNSPFDVTTIFNDGPTGGSAINGFNLYYSNDDVTYSSIVNNTNSNFTYDTITQGTKYFKSESINNVGTGTLSTAYSITTPNVPDAITDLSGSATSDTQINISWTAPNDQGSNIDLYKIFKDGVQVDTTTNTNYSLTGLSSNTAYAITVYTNNSVGDSLVSNTENITTYQTVSGSITVTPTTQGATTQLTFTSSNITGTPTPTFNIFTLKEGSTVIASGVSTPYTLSLNDNSPHTFTITSTDNTHWDTPTISGNAIVTASYDPTWKNNVSYNYTRGSGVMDLTVNKDSQSLWDATCNYKTTTEVLNDQSGIQSNHTGVWYISESQSIADIDTVYVSCNDDGDTLFSFTSFGPNRLGGGIAQLDDTFEGMIGTPVALIFVLLVAGLFTGRSAPTGILLVLALVGVLGFIGMLTIDEAVWGFLLLAGVLGIFLGKRFL